ncbi:GH39 family glycosyl hydrolase [Leptolyngbya sp. FACHB-261]|uniref:GH39 family glycosyl hydrolase n=1 Tax=Leptolyngbya sp. FACHB-261 TaxID=2692806 RepID=UPI001689DB6F|nr:hypothetical protein [Leptolyngbya sp. FACHB-261]MBD2101881.1 hypothetical protein [Leptolyngbya sp. FACHB-261]
MSSNNGLADKNYLGQSYSLHSSDLSHSGSLVNKLSADAQLWLQYSNLSRSSSTNAAPLNSAEGSNSAASIQSGSSQFSSNSNARLIAATAQTPVQVNVDWGTVQGTTSQLHFGLNAFRGFNPQDATNPAYNSNLAYMNPGIIRYHNAGMMNDSAINPDGLIDVANRRWDTTKITQALSASLGAFTNQPLRLINIPDWPAWMDANRDGFLDTNQFDNYAAFCAELVKIVNRDNQFGVTHWEVTNEKDGQYFTQFRNNSGWGPLKDPSKPDRLDELSTIYNKCATAMHQMDPTIKIGGPALSRPDLQPFYSRFINATTQNLDFFSFHAYASGSRDTPDTNVYDGTRSIGRYTKSIVDTLNQASPNRHIPVFLDEYNISWTWQTRDARMAGNKGTVFDALAMVEAINNGADATLAWNEKDEIYGKTDSRNALRPSAHMFHLFNQLLVGNRVATTSSDNQSVVAFAVSNPTSAQHSYLLINRSNQVQQVQTTFQGWTPTGSALARYEVSANGYSQKTTDWATVSSNSFQLPDNSVTLLSFAY